MRFQARDGLGTFVRGLRHITGFNPVHFAARPLAERFGIVKTELLRDNPCGVPLDWYDRTVASPERAEADDFVRNSRKHYKASGQGLTVLAGETSPFRAFAW